MGHGSKCMINDPAFNFLIYDINLFASQVYQACYVMEDVIMFYGRDVCFGEDGRCGCKNNKNDLMGNFRPFSFQTYDILSFAYEIIHTGGCHDRKCRGYQKTSVGRLFKVCQSPEGKSAEECGT
jgi:hypothetical protein